MLSSVIVGAAIYSVLARRGLGFIGCVAYFGLMGITSGTVGLLASNTSGQVGIAFGGLFTMVALVMLGTAVKAFWAIALVGLALSLLTWKHRARGDGLAALCLLGVFVLAYGAFGWYAVTWP